MAKEQFTQEWEAMLMGGSGSMPLQQVLEGLTALISRHPDTFAGISYSYRLIASDTGVSCAFMLENGLYAPLNEAADVDVTLSGKEQHLLAIFNRQLKPAAALLTGKLKVKGSLVALNTLTAFF